MIRVLVVDDHAVVRAGLRHVLAAGDGFDVVGEAADGGEAVAQAQALTPDVILLDLTMPGMGGLEATAALRTAVPASRILVLTMHDHGEYVVEALRAGAHGYLLKDSAPVELRHAIETVHAGGRHLGPGIKDALAEGLAQATSKAGERAAIDTLTPREREVMALVATGRTSKEVGAELGISSRTVETHRESVMKKLGIRSVAELTRLALEHEIG